MDNSLAESFSKRLKEKASLELMAEDVGMECDEPDDEPDDPQEATHISKKARLSQ